MILLLLTAPTAHITYVKRCLRCFFYVFYVENGNKHCDLTVLILDLYALLHTIANIVKKCLFKLIAMLMTLLVFNSLLRVWFYNSQLTICVSTHG